MHREPITLLVASFAKPTLIGVYSAQNELIRSFAEDGKITDFLYQITSEIDKNYLIKRLVYTQGPGSFMGLKLAYVFLASFAIARNIPFEAISSFAIASKIHAHKNRWFVQNGDRVEVVEMADQTDLIALPRSIDSIAFESDKLPRYELPAV